MSSKYATLEDVGKAISKLEEKVPSRWEMRATLLAAVVVTNFNVPDEVTKSAVAAGAVAVAVKAGLTLFRAS